MKKIKSWTYTCVTTYNETARNIINDVTITEIIILYLHQYIYKQLALAHTKPWKSLGKQHQHTWQVQKSSKEEVKLCIFHILNWDRETKSNTT